MPAATTKTAKAATRTPAAKARVVKAPVAKAPTAKARAVKAPVAKAPAAKAPTAKARAVKAPVARSAKVPQPRAGVAATTSKTAKARTAAAKTADLSQDVFTSVEAGQRTAIAAVRTFVDTVDKAIPALGEHPSRRETVIDAALDMADKLVTTQYHFLRSVVRSADRSLKLSNGKGK